jgi:hypothetical protein
MGHAMTANHNKAQIQQPSSIKLDGKMLYCNWQQQLDAAAQKQLLARLGDMAMSV